MLTVRVITEGGELVATADHDTDREAWAEFSEWENGDNDYFVQMIQDDRIIAEVNNFDR